MAGVSAKRSAVMVDGAQKVSVGEILGAWSAALSRYGSVCLLAGGLIAVVGTLMDLTLGDRGAQLVTSIASFFIQYHLVEYVLARDFGLPSGQRHYGSAFGAAVVATLGAGAAMLLLIVPGLYVASRWSLANALVIGEGFTAIDSLRESWRRTAGSVWAIVGIYLILGLAFVIAIVVLGVTVGLAGTPDLENSFAATLGGNVVGGVISVVVSLLTCAIYGLICKPAGALDDVFG
jgi:hypothetical protein